MHKFITSFLLLLVFQCAKAQPQPPHQLYGELFRAVQLQPVFPDSKTFVDCIPKEDPVAIVKQYEAEKKKPGFDLREFVALHFNLPKERGNHYKSNIQAGVRKHIEELWDVLKREPDEEEKFSTLLPLPNAYIVPGGRFREVYYWDSYFTMLGLQESKRYDMIENMVRNFSFLINEYGFIPNGNRSYYLTRSQPPFFSLMVGLLAQSRGNYVFATYQPALLKEYEFWMDGSDKLKPGQSFRHAVRMQGGELLNRYWDDAEAPRDEAYKEDFNAAQKSHQPPVQFYHHIRAAAESGWDFSSRWFADGKNMGTIHTTDMVEVDLNCLLYNLERSIAMGYTTTGDQLQAGLYNDKAEKRKKAILKYCWNEKMGWYTDYLFHYRQPSSQLTLAGVYPLFFSLASPAQAGKIAKKVATKFLKPGGVVTTLQKTGQQWDAPNGWAPLQWMTVAGLENYGANSLAETIARRWVALNIKIFKNTGKLLEKYNVTDINTEAGGGEYPLQDGFGWTNGVLLRMMNKYQIAE